MTLRYADCSRGARSSTSLSIGRSADCDVVIAPLGIARARDHCDATGKVQLDDRSSLGTYVSMHDGS